MATLTRKFSQFVAGSLNNANQTVGLSGGVNAIFPGTTTWSTAGRPATPTNGLLGYNTTSQQYEYWDSVIAAWIPISSGGDVLPLLASHDPGEGASLVGLNPTGTVQDLANSTFVLNTASAAAPFAQVLGALNSGVMKSATTTGIVSISIPLTSIDGLTTAADQMLYTTGANIYATTGLTAYMRTLLDDADAATAAATLGVLPLLGGTMLGNVDMGGFRIRNAANPALPQDYATKFYVDSGSFLPLSGGTMSGVINMGSNKITNLTDPTNPQDAVTLFYVSNQLGNYLPKSGGTMDLNTGIINMNNSKITNLATCTNSGDAANKAYVDLVAVGLTIQPAVYASTTTNLTATYANGAAGINATLTNSGAMAAFATDGVSPPINSRIIVPFQSSTLQNGIYTLTTVGSGAANWVLTRATDYDQPSEITPGDLVVVNNGTTYGGGSFIETAAVSTIGTDPILFSVFTFAPSTFLLKANNLMDVASTVASFNNISPTTTKGDLIVDDGTNDIRLGVGANGTILQANSGVSAGVQYTTATYPTTTTINQILYSSASNVIGGIATLAGGVLVTNNLGVPSMLTNPAAVGRMLQSANAAIPTWSTSAYPSGAGTAGKLPISNGTDFVLSTSIWPNTVGTAGQIIRSDGTINTYSTAVFANTYAASTLLYSNGANNIAGLPTGLNGVLVTDNASVPSISAGPAATARILLSNAAAAPAWSAYTIAAPSTSGNVLTSDGTNWTSAAPPGSSTSTITDDTTTNATMYPVWVTANSGSLPLKVSSTKMGFNPSTGRLTLTSLAFNPTTNGIVGTTTNDDAAAGYVGEYVESIILSGSAVALTTGGAKTITSISLTAGDWDVSGLVLFVAAGTTQITQITGAVSLTNNSLGTSTDSAGSLNFLVSTGGTSWTFGAVNCPNLPLTPCRISVNTTTTVYLVGRAAFSVSTCSGYGKIIARRVR